MGNDVFANGREISCKAADGKAIAAFPDVCFTPPQTAATPPGVPIPYPNTAFAKDTTKGSKKVKISGKEVMLKNKSYFKTSTGNEAGNAPKKGVMTSKIKGKAYFTSWSMDVKFEGKNVVRHMDMTTHNHGSNPNTATWVYADRMALAGGISECKGDVNKAKKACSEQTDSNGKIKCPCGHNVGAVKRAKNMSKGPSKNAALKTSFKNYSKCMQNDDCQAASRCLLVEKKSKEDSKSKGTCCPPQTPHHIVPGSQFKNPDISNYDYDKGPCICVEGNSQTQGSHGGIHFTTAEKTKNMFPPADQPFSGDERWSVGEAEEVGAEAVSEEFGCNPKCIKAQVRKKHREMGIRKKDKIKPTAPGPVKHPMNESSDF